jgi:hypothetical protein
MRKDFQHWILNEAKKKAPPPPMLGDTGSIPSGIGPTDDEMDKLDKLMEPPEELPDDDDEDSPLADLLGKLPKIDMPKVSGPSTTAIEISWKPLSTGKSHKPKSKARKKK